MNFSLPKMPVLPPKPSIVIGISPLGIFHDLRVSDYYPFYPSIPRLIYTVSSLKSSPKPENFAAIIRTRLSSFSGHETDILIETCSPAIAPQKPRC
jgi:hypothetical protein